MTPKSTTLTPTRNSPLMTRTKGCSTKISWTSWSQLPIRGSYAHRHPAEKPANYVKHAALVGNLSHQNWLGCVRRNASLKLVISITYIVMKLRVYNMKLCDYDYICAYSCIITWTATYIVQLINIYIVFFNLFGTTISFQL